MFRYIPKHKESLGTYLHYSEIIQNCAWFIIILINHYLNNKKKNNANHPVFIFERSLQNWNRATLFQTYLKNISERLII